MLGGYLPYDDYAANVILNDGVPVPNPRANGSSGGSSSSGALTDAEYLAIANQWGLSTAGDSPYKDIVDTLRNADGFTSVTNVPVSGGTLSYNQKTGESSFSSGGVTVSGVSDVPITHYKSTNNVLGSLHSVAISFDPQVVSAIFYSELYASLSHKSLHQLKEWDQDFYEGVKAIQTQYGLQVRLDALGYIPVIGDVADIINGSLYLMQGDVSNAKFYFIAAVPFVGDGAKLVRKLATSEVANVFKAAGIAGKLPNSSTKVITQAESKAPNAMKSIDVTNSWDSFLGQNTTNINPVTGNPDLNRIFSADGTKSIRLGNHEMTSMGTPKGHFHYETWTYDPISDTMTVTNVVQRIIP